MNVESSCTFPFQSSVTPFRIKVSNVFVVVVNAWYMVSTLASDQEEDLGLQAPASCSAVRCSPTFLSSSFLAGCPFS